MTDRDRACTEFADMLALVLNPSQQVVSVTRFLVVDGKRVMVVVSEPRSVKRGDE